jgi:hypothetical protein
MFANDLLDVLGNGADSHLAGDNLLLPNARFFFDERNALLVAVIRHSISVDPQWCAKACAMTSNTANDENVST